MKTSHTATLPSHFPTGMPLMEHSQMAPCGVGWQRDPNSWSPHWISHPQDPSLPTKHDCPLQPPLPEPALATATEGPPDVVNAPVLVTDVPAWPTDGVPELPEPAALLPPPLPPEPVSTTTLPPQPAAFARATAKQETMTS